MVATLIRRSAIGAMHMECLSLKCCSIVGVQRITSTYVYIGIKRHRKIKKNYGDNEGIYPVCLRT